MNPTLMLLSLLSAATFALGALQAEAASLLARNDCYDNCISKGHLPDNCKLGCFRHGPPAVEAASLMVTSQCFKRCVRHGNQPDGCRLACPGHDPHA
ncbi:hypothetical protein CF328_g8391 [Tilletia controversa]|nr:hypothetical protein CF328_g8391 [Tilletia controversa]